MLRLLVLLLLLANVLFGAWTLGWLDSVVGVRADGDREPGRMALQVEPEVIRILPPAPPASSTGTSSSATGAAAFQLGAAAALGLAGNGNGNGNDRGSTCLEAGPLLPTQVGTATAALQTVLPPNRWTSERREVPGVWIIFMGRYSDPEVRQRKAEELRRLGVASEEVRAVPELGEGLSLGRFSDREAADQALAGLTPRGVRTARVVRLSPAGIAYMLRIDGLGDGDATALPALQARLNGLEGIALMGHPFKACAAPPSASTSSS